MKFPASAFNLFLLASLCLSPGCKTAQERERENLAAGLRFHLEMNPDGSSQAMQVPVYRARPMILTVRRDAVLDEAFMKKAEIVSVDEHGGWGIKITFDPAGRRRLENITTANKGRRLGIFAQWKEQRWLAAPLITHNNSSGVFIFTPDASREEAEEIVLGLNNVIEKLNKPYVF